MPAVWGGKQSCARIELPATVEANAWRHALQVHAGIGAHDAVGQPIVPRRPARMNTTHPRRTAHIGGFSGTTAARRRPLPQPRVESLLEPTL